MRKILTLIAALCCFVSVNAAEAPFWDDDADIDHSGLFANPTIGLMTGDVDNDLGIDLTIGYRWNFTEGFSWDIVKVGANTGVSNFTENMTLRFLSGLRYNSPEIIWDKSLYADVALGYCVLTDVTDLNGFAYEIGGGFNLTPHISLGLVWEGNCPTFDFYGDTYKVNYGTIGLRLGLNF